MRTPTLSRPSAAARKRSHCFLFFRALSAAIFLLAFHCVNGQAGGGTTSPYTAETSNRADRLMKGSARVNPHTLALEFTVSLMNYPGRNGNDVNAAFSYSSKVWRMDAGATWWYPVNTARRYLTDVNARFAERTAAGWTSLMAPPILEESRTFYDQYGEPWSDIIGDESAMDGIWQEALSSGNDGLTASPNFRCVSYTHVYCPECVLPDGSVGAHIFICNGWEIGGGIPEPGWPSGSGGGTGTQLFYAARVYVTMPGGSRHEFRKDDEKHLCGVPGQGCEPDLMGTFLSTDGTGMRLERGSEGSELFLPNGSRYVFPATAQAGGEGIYAERFIDVNGNFTEYQRNTAGPSTSYSVHDTMGREVADPLPYNWFAQTQRAGEMQSSLPGFGGLPSVFGMKWSRLKPEGCEASSDPDCAGVNGDRGGALEDQAQKLYFDSRYFCRGSATEDLLSDPDDPYSDSNEVLFPVTQAGVRPCGAFTMRTAADGSTVPAPSRFNPVVLREITLPDGRSYRFGYNRFGEISKIVYPTGVFEVFEYGPVVPFGGVGGAAFDQSNRGVLERRIYDSSGELRQRWNYSAETQFAPGNNSTYKVTAAVSKADDPSLPGSKTETILFSPSGGDEFGFRDPLSGAVSELREFDENGSLRSRKLFSWTSRGPLPNGVPNASRDLRAQRTIAATFEPDSQTALVTMSATGFDEQVAQDPAHFPHLNATSSETWGYGAVERQLAADGSISELTAAAIEAGAKRLNLTRRTFLYDPAYLQKGLLAVKTSERTLDPAGSGELLNETRFEYDGPDETLIDPGQAAGWTDPVSSIRGNITSVRKWDRMKQIWLTERFRFDKFGNPRITWDASGDPGKYNEIEYSADYGFAYPTVLRSPSPDPSGTSGTSEPSETVKEYDLTTGLLTRVIDRQSLSDAADDRVTTTEYGDPLLRPTAVTEPNGARHLTAYVDSPGRSLVITRSPVAEGVWKESTETLDGFGRRLKTTDKRDEGVSVVEFRYDLHGRQTAVSAPYFESGGQEEIRWSATEYDAAGRVHRTFTPEGPDGAPLLAAEFSYGISQVAGSVGTYIVRKDSTGRSAREIRDATGRILRTDEPTGATGDPEADLGTLGSPRQPTYYRYSKSGLLSETIQGEQKRYFLYDPFGRVLRQRIPEQEPNPDLAVADSETGNSEWTSGFDYDPLGNPIESIDANGTHILTSYDRLNRRVSVTYSDGTPQETYRYDQVPYGKGKLIEASNANSARRSLEFDEAGNLLRSEQLTAGVSYVTRFRYNLDGSPVETTYPSGKKVFQEFGSDGKLRRVSGADAFGSRTYSSGFGYAADGKTAHLKLGNGRWESALYGPSGRLRRVGIGNSSTDLSLWSAGYEYGEAEADGEIDATRNNGSIARITVRLNGWPDAFVQTFAYDPVMRLSLAREESAGAEAWSQRFEYDRFGNRTPSAQSIGGAPGPPVTPVDPLTNRFTGGQGYSYDRNGNVVGDPGGRSIIFDGRNKQVEIRRADGSLEGRYFYDAEGRRVRTETPLETAVFVYAADRLVAEYSTAPPESQETRYLTYDHLESPRIVTGKDGSVLSRRDYLPFGDDLFSGIGHRNEAYAYSVNGGEVRQGFAGYLNDRESGLNFAEARMYDSANGRFTSVDPLVSSADETDPQSLNRYSYTRNDPVNLNDPTGLFAVDDWYVADNGQMEVFRTEDSFDRFYVYDENRNVFVLVAQLDKNSRGLVRFPNEGYGFTYYNPGERGGYDSSTGERVGQGDHYLLPVTAAALFGFTNQLRNDFGVTLALGDMSASNGSDPWDARYRSADWNGHHSSHGHLGNGTGQNIDFRYVDSNGNSQRGNWAESPGMFSRGKNQAVFDLARKWGFGKSLRGNDVPIRGTRAAKGHNDHGHLGFDLSRKKPKVLKRDRRRWYMRPSEFTFACDVDACTNR